VCCRAVGEAPHDDQGETCDQVLLEVLEEKITVAELIRRTVHEQVRALLARRGLEAAEVRQAIVRRYLSAAEVARQAAAGKVALPGDVPAGESVDAEAEAQRAVESFERGAFVVLVNGRQVGDADEELTFEDQASVTFLRLTPLVGG